MDKKNILWICTDQQRYDTITSLGNPFINTPNLDRLVQSGTTFTRAYCQSPVCTPSRVSFLTGRYPSTARCRQNGQNIPEDEVLVTKLLADYGYDGGLVGKLHISSCYHGVEKRIDDGYRSFQWSHDQSHSNENAYHEWLEEKSYNLNTEYKRVKGAVSWNGVPEEYHHTTWCFEKAQEFISENRNGPWFLSLNTFDPHPPFNPPKSCFDEIDWSKIPLPRFDPFELENKTVFQKNDSLGSDGGVGFNTSKSSEDERRKGIAVYYAMIQLLDSKIGELLDYLEGSEQREETIIIFCSDHGEMLFNHGIVHKGPYFYDDLMRVPLIVSCPGTVLEDARYDTFVELMDLAPTILDAVGLEKYVGMQGRSFWDLCKEYAPEKTHRENVYAQAFNCKWGHHSPKAYGTMLRTKQYKVCVYHGINDGELYDLEKDPGEFNNLWNDSDYSEIKQTMILENLDRTVFTMDPVPLRKGAY